MNDGLARVRATLGPEEESGVADSMIKDALWNEYFNVENAIQGIFGSSDLVSAYRFDLTSSAWQRNKNEIRRLWNAKVRCSSQPVHLFLVLSFSPVILCNLPSFFLSGCPSSRPGGFKTRYAGCFCACFLYLSLPCVAS